MLVICFAPSGTPPWNKHQSHRLPNVPLHRKENYNSARNILKPRWPGRTPFLSTGIAVTLPAYSQQVNERPFLEAETYTLHFLLPSLPPKIQQCWLFIRVNLLMPGNTVGAWYLQMDWRKVENSNLESYYLAFMNITVLEKHMVKHNLN